MVERNLMEIDPVSQKFEDLKSKFNQDLLTRGFTTWFREKESGVMAVYHRNRGVKFSSISQIVDGRQVNQVLEAAYKLKGHEIDVNIEQEPNSPYATVMVWLDHQTVVAAKTDPLSPTQNILRTIHKDDFTDGFKINPEEFALKTLDDFSSARVDTKKVTRMYNDFKAEAEEEQSGHIVKRNRSAKYL